MHESPCRTMLRQAASTDRLINKFPQPYKPSLSPYNQMDFHVKVKEACISNRMIITGLKISKALVLGDVAVGKTSLVRRFCHQVFEKDYRATIGVDFEVERFDILQVPFNLQIWDTAGQERFKCIASSYYRGAHVIIVVFDVTDLLSLKNSKRWLREALEASNETPHIFLVGTKIDICSIATYNMVEEQATIVARDMNAEYWGVSSKTGENVQSFFLRVAALTFDAGVLREIDTAPPSQQIGNNLIKINGEPKDLYEKKNRTKCFTC